MSDPREAERERDLHPHPTSPSDVVGWLTGHYREHIPDVRKMAGRAPAS
jgi:hypothetical protein